MLSFVTLLFNCTHALVDIPLQGCILVDVSQSLFLTQAFEEVPCCDCDKGLCK